MSTITLSDEALALLRSYAGDIRTDDVNREPCRELASQGLLVAGHDFSLGREAFYRLTDLGLQFIENTEQS